MPVRVELDALNVDDFRRILTEPDHSLIKQYTALLATESLHLEFTDNGIEKIAEIAYHVNKTTENIGARRLHTLMERLTESLSFEAADRPDGDHIRIDAAYVEKRPRRTVAKRRLEPLRALTFTHKNPATRRDFLPIQQSLFSVQNVAAKQGRAGRP